MKLFLLLCATLPLGALDLSISAESAILMDAETGHVLYEKGAMERRYPASITKILTTLVAVEQEGDLEEMLTVPNECVSTVTPEDKLEAAYQLPSYLIETDSSHVGLKAGEELTLEALLYGVMLESGNDAANTLAYHIAGDIPIFVEAMNIRAEQIGCQKTHFTNPHGLHHPDHFTCAYDMALMTQEALAHPLFRQLAKAQVWKKGATNKQDATIWVQHNQLVKRGKKYFYPKAIGVKTGRTDNAGATLVAAAQEGGRELIAVVLGCPDHPAAYADVTHLFEAAFTEPKVQQCLVRRGKQPYTNQVGRKKLTTYTEKDAVIEYLPSYVPDVHTEIFWKRVQPPIFMGDVVGHIEGVTAEGQKLTQVPLYAARAIGAPFKLSDIGFIPEGIKWSLVGICAVVFGALVFFKRARERRSAPDGSVEHTEC